MVALEGAAGLKHPAAGSPAGRAAQIAEALVRRIYDDKPWNDRTDRNLAVVLRRVRLRLGLCHPPSGAVALAVIGVKVNTPERLQRRPPAFGQTARLNRMTVSAKRLRFEVRSVNFRRMRVRNESTTICTETFGLRRRWLDGQPEAILVDPPVWSTARSLPLPHLDRSVGVAGVVKATARQSRRFIRKRRRPHMKRAIPRHGSVELRQQDGKLVFVIFMRIGNVIAILKNVPTVFALDHRQMLERPRWIVPDEAEINALAVVHGTYINFRFAFAIEVPAERRPHRKWLDGQPHGVRRIAVEDGQLGCRNLSNVQPVLHCPVHR